MIKKIIQLCLIIIVVILFEGCLKNTNELNIDQNIASFESQKLGVSFKYIKSNPNINKGSLITFLEINDQFRAYWHFDNIEDDCSLEQDCIYINGLKYMPIIPNTPYIIYKSKEESIDDAIKQLIRKENKNPENCFIEKYEVNGQKRANIRPKNPINLTKKELEKYASSSFPEEVGKNEKLIELCSSYSSDNQYFIYDDNVKNKFIHFAMNPLNIDKALSPIPESIKLF